MHSMMREIRDPVTRLKGQAQAFVSTHPYMSFLRVPMRFTLISSPGPKELPLVPTF